MQDKDVLISRRWTDDIHLFVLLSVILLLRLIYVWDIRTDIGRRVIVFVPF